MIDRSTLTRLVAGAGRAVSVYLAMDPEQRDRRGAEAELRQLVGKARHSLQRRGLPPERIDALLAPAALRFDTETELIEHREYGRVFFHAGSQSHVFVLPEPIPQSVVVGRNFQLRPLLPLLAHHRRFHILALSAAAANLLDATAFGIVGRRNVAAAQVAAAPRVQVDVAASAANEGKGSTGERRGEKPIEYWRQVAGAVAHAIGDDPAPLVLVAEPEATGHFRKVAKLPQLQSEGLQLNPHGLAEADLLKKVVALLQPVFDRELAGVLDRVNPRLGTAEPTVSIRLEEILPAAYDGRVDAVVVESGQPVWGRYDVQARVVHAHGTPDEQEDLPNEAAVVTLRNGGRAFASPRDRMPRHVSAAATFRY